MAFVELDLLENFKLKEITNKIINIYLVTFCHETNKWIVIKDKAPLVDL